MCVFSYVTLHFKILKKRPFLPLHCELSSLSLSSFPRIWIGKKIWIGKRIWIGKESLWKWIIIGKTDYLLWMRLLEIETDCVYHSANGLGYNEMLFLCVVLRLKLNSMFCLFPSYLFCDMWYLEEMAKVHFLITIMGFLFTCHSSEWSSKHFP